jgi:SagB-type dehydrogenase family enzyme
MSEEVLTTSPLLFAHCGRNGRLVASDARGSSRFRLTGKRAAEIVTAFLEPRSIASAVDDGFTLDELQEAREAGILISEKERGSFGLWERHGWSRPAYLMLSQMDIPYQESQDAMDDRLAVTVERREAVEAYESAQRPPQPRWLAGGESVDLPQPPTATPNLSTLTSRRSVRGFSPSPPRAEEMAGVLHAATHSFRAAAADRADGDPFRLLNSFYSWAHLFVVVQDVEDVPRGAFEYDWMHHRLLHSAGPCADGDVLACVQGQRGVLGTGFVVFIVADLRRYAWLYRHSRAYLHLLIQVGELGQELLMAATELGLGGWPSPAVHESRSAAILGLPEDDAVDVLSMVKLGRPVRTRVGNGHAAVRS